jgi:hypothetical protein
MFPIRFGSVEADFYIIFYYYYSHSGGWSPNWVNSTQHACHFWPIVPAPGDYEDGEFGGMKIDKGKPKYSEKTYPSATMSTTNPT